MAFATSFLSSVPRITADENRLIAATSLPFRIVTLGLSIRRVTVDRELKLVTIEDRKAWIWHRRISLHFNEIESITYGYDDVSLSGVFQTAHDSVDRFVVGLKPYGRDEVVLFNFVGDGTFTNEGPLPDWWYWKEYATDWSGTQQQESRLFVQLLSKLIGVSTAPSTLTS
jgi:hypothetical protein